MKIILMLFFLFSLPVSEYTVIDIKNNQLNYYVILIKDNKTSKFYCFETRETDASLKNKMKIKIGDIVRLKLRKQQISSKFKISKKIKPFDDLNIYDDSLKVNKNYYCEALNGLFLEKTS
jgi:translation initiation factor IF-1